MTREEAIQCLTELGVSPEHIMELIEALKQEPYTGHWVTDVDNWGNGVTTVIGYRCYNCNGFVTNKYNYCPKCGALMIRCQKMEDNNEKNVK